MAVANPPEYMRRLAEHRQVRDSDAGRSVVCRSSWKWPMTFSFGQLAPQLSRALGVPRDRLREAFRPATEADIPGILDLRRQVSGDVWWDDNAYVRWRYFDPMFAGRSVPYWVFEKDREIIGGVGLEPVVLVVDGEEHAAVRGMDIMVRQDYDGRGLGVMMNLIVQEHFPVTLVAGSNERSHNLVSKMLEHTLDLRVWKLLIRTRRFIDRRVNLGPLRHVMAAVGDSALALDRARRRRRPPEYLQLRELTLFDEQVTELSRACDLAGRISVRRSAEYLNWRFTRNPRCHYRIHGAFEGARLVGYVVSMLKPTGQKHTCEGALADWLADTCAGSGATPLRFLMQAAMDKLIDEGANVISCLAYGAHSDQVIGAAGFRPRPPGVPFFVRASEAALHTRLASRQGWFLTGCDFDID
jgi:GNAT superfamily N-acetyltransferase